MSGSVVLSLLSAVDANRATDIGSSLLATLFSASSTSDTPAAAVSALKTAEANQTQDIAQEANQPSVQRDVAAFVAGVQSATSVSQLLSNQAVLKVLLTANGLGDQLGYPALAQKALTSDPADPASLANRLTNTNWKSTAQTYQFAAQGLAIIQQPAVVSQLSSAYAEVLWRQSLDSSHPGLSDALTFRSRASAITSVDQILGDPILRNVVTTALGIPKQIAVQPLEAQESAISSRLDISQFRNPSFVDNFTQRFLIANTQSAAAAGGAGGLVSLASQSAGLVV